MPFSARRFSSAIDQPGSTVEHITKTLPAFMAAAAPPSPNKTASVCAALTTTLITTSQAAGHLCRAAAGNAAFCGKGLGHLAANIEDMDSVTGSP